MNNDNVPRRQDADAKEDKSSLSLLTEGELADVQGGGGDADHEPPKEVP